MKKLCWMMFGMLPFLTAQADLRCVNKTTTGDDLYVVAVSGSDGYEKASGFGSTSAAPAHDALALCNAMLSVTSCSEEGVLQLGGASKGIFNVVLYLSSGSNTSYEFDNTDHHHNYGSGMMCERSRARLIAEGVATLSRKLKAEHALKTLVRINQLTACSR